jgi:hypothetical protein
MGVFPDDRADTMANPIDRKVQDLALIIAVPLVGAKPTVRSAIHPTGDKT